MGFWHKAANIGKSVGKIAMASAGMVMSAVVGTALTVAALGITQVPAWLCLLGSVIAYRFDRNDLGTSLFEAAFNLSIFGSIMRSISNSNYRLGKQVFEKTQDLTLEQKKIIQDEIGNIKRILALTSTKKPQENQYSLNTPRTAPD